METRFTPGPWKADRYDNKRFEVNSDVEKWSCVADCSANHLGSREVMPGEAKANARLISAAPDGYAVCEALVDLCRPIDVGFDVVAHDMPVTVPASIIQAARAYLAKARGDSTGT